jgi:hypothetical protein
MPPVGVGFLVVGFPVRGCGVLGFFVVGFDVVGRGVGRFVFVGDFDGLLVGRIVGDLLGSLVGDNVGRLVFVGATGFRVGLDDVGLAGLTVMGLDVGFEDAGCRV